MRAQPAVISHFQLQKDVTWIWERSFSVCWTRVVQHGCLLVLHTVIWRYHQLCWFSFYILKFSSALGQLFRYSDNAQMGTDQILDYMWWNHQIVAKLTLQSEVLCYIQPANIAFSPSSCNWHPKELIHVHSFWHGAFVSYECAENEAFK